MRFVSFLYQVLAIILLTTLLSLMTAFGWFGSGPQAALDALWKPVYAFYISHKDSIDRAAALAGAAITAVTGTQAIMKSWYYAEYNLPQRLADLIKDVIEKGRTDRAVMIEAVSGRTLPSNFLAKDEYVNPFRSIWEQIKKPSETASVHRMANSVDAINKELATLEAARIAAQSRSVTAHILRGLYFNTQAKSAEDGRALRRDALNEFEAALKVNERNLDALRFAADVNRALGHEEPSIAHLQTLIRVATSGNKPIRAAWARRELAEIYQARSTEKSLQEASIILRTAVKELEPQVHRKQEGKKEIGLCYKLLGEVQTQRERFVAARTALSNAEYYGIDVARSTAELDRSEQDTGQDGD